MACETNQESMADVDLKVNGQKVELNPFIQGFISETVTGMLKSLRGVNGIDTVDMKITKKTKST